MKKHRKPKKERKISANDTMQVKIEILQVPMEDFTREKKK